MTYIQIIHEVTKRLEKAGIDSARTECEIMLSELLKCPCSELFMSFSKPVPQDIAEALGKIVQRRERREPLQYILGHAYFMKLDLEVNQSVLIPRPETEIMVERLSKIIPHGSSVLDLGTGSGAIALALAFERNDLHVCGVDISCEALSTAERNLGKYKLNNVEFILSDLFDKLEGRRFDYIAANLPYVTEEEYTDLMPEVKEFEPKLALTAPNNGLDLIYRCIKDAPDHLNQGGGIIFEMGITQAHSVHKALEDDGKFKNIKTIQDYSRRDRFVLAELS